MTECVLVTGAAGFIGRAVVAALADAGHHVLAAIHRTPLPDDLVAHPSVTPAALAFTGGVPQIVPKGGASAPAPTAIVHAAYGAGSGPAGGIPQLAAAANALGITTFIAFSSIAYYGAATGTVTETTPPAGDPGAYGRDKQEGEAALAAWAAGSASPAAAGDATSPAAHAAPTGGSHAASAAGMPVRRAVALRPGAVYGPDSTFWTVKLLRRIRLGAWGRFGALGEGPCPLVHVSEVADATVAALANAPAGFSAYNLVADDSLTWNAYFTALAAADGRTLPDLAPATVKARVAASVPAKVWRKLGGSGLEAAALAPTRGELATFARAARYDSAAARTALGWRPNRDTAAAIAEAVRETRA